MSDTNETGGAPLLALFEKWAAASHFPLRAMDTFEGLSSVADEDTVARFRLRLEDVASGYWTPPFTRSSGLVSHYASSPGRPADKVFDELERQDTDT